MDTQIVMISGWMLILQTFILLDGVKKQVTSFIHLKVLFSLNLCVLHSSEIESTCVML